MALVHGFTASLAGQLLGRFTRSIVCIILQYCIISLVNLESTTGQGNSSREAKVRPSKEQCLPGHGITIDDQYGQAGYFYHQRMMI